MQPGASASPSPSRSGGDMPSAALAAHRVTFLQRCLLAPDATRPPDVTALEPPSSPCEEELAPCRTQEDEQKESPEPSGVEASSQKQAKDKVPQGSVVLRRRTPNTTTPARRISFKVRASAAARRSRLLDARSACCRPTAVVAGSAGGGVAALASRFQELIGDGGAGAAETGERRTATTRKANASAQRRAAGGDVGGGDGRRVTRRSSRASSTAHLQEPSRGSNPAAVAGGASQTPSSAAPAAAMQRVNVRAAIQIFESAAAAVPPPKLTTRRRLSSSSFRLQQQQSPPPASKPTPTVTIGNTFGRAMSSRNGYASIVPRKANPEKEIRPPEDVPAVAPAPQQVEAPTDRESPKENHTPKEDDSVEPKKVEGMETTVRGQAESPPSLMGCLEPNASFLWRAGTASTPTTPTTPPLPPRPLIVPEENKAEEEVEEGLYDDILAPAVVSAGENGDYQDIGPPGSSEDIYESCEEETYDDCVPAPPRLPPKPRTSLLQDHDPEGVHEGVEEGVHEGVEAVKEEAEDALEDLYDDVRTLLPLSGMADETRSIMSNCYESIGGGSHVLRPGSSCDHNNSLYTPGSVRSAPSARTASPASGSDGNDTYAPSSVTSGDTSATSGETSEWMDVDVSDTDSMRVRLPQLLLHERSRNRKSPNWSRKVRDQWTKHQGANEDDVDSCYNMEDHNYETLDDLTGVNNSGSVGADDSDSFDSHSSGCESSPNNVSEGCAFDKELPEPPQNQNIYGISKIAEAAGKKMMELGRSLRRIRSKSALGIDQQGTETQTSIKPVSNQQEQNIKTSPSSTTEKSRSSNNSSGRKTWTLRKLRQSVAGSTSVSNSTFYLSPAAITGNKGGSMPQLSLTEGLINQKRRNVSNKVENSTGNDYTTMKRNNIVSRTSLPNNVIRPSSPPPLPPAFISEIGRQKPEREVTNTTWYTESGLFDGNSDSLVKRPQRPNRSNSSNWYAAMGVWNSAVIGIPVKESVPIEGSLTSEKPAEVVERPSHFLQDEPLYQFYIDTLTEMVQSDAEGRFDSDGYEEIAYKTPKSANRPTAMELIQPRKGENRMCTLWCEVPDVVQSQVLSTLSQHDKKLQEAKFEIITSEASYINSLNVLESYFMSSPELNDDSILSKNDRKILFGNVMPVKKCSENFLADLEKCWQESIFLHKICDTVLAHTSKFLDVYVKYCKNQIYLDRTLRQLKEQNGQFGEVLKRLEGSSKCKNLTLHSFLMLPMQRITRLPLLIDAVHNRLHRDDEEYQSSELALATLNKIVYECNEGARHMERLEQIFILSNQLEFPKEVKHIPLMQSSRYLVRSGEVMQFIGREDAKLTFGKKMTKTLHLFLFSDLLVVARKKSEESFTVLDYCPRNLVQISCSEDMSRLRIKSMEACSNLLVLTLLQNHENKTTEMYISCSGVSDKERWYEALSQPISENPGETVYEEWDCPQVIARHSYTASQPDELSLEVNDAVNVLRKMTDGWYQGERIRDGERGWFPGNHCVEILSAHVRARNLKQRYRLLALSGNYLEQQKERVK